jgi:type IV pilus assembly protein PilM
VKRVGVDIGSTAVRVVQVNGVDSDSLARVAKSSVVSLVPGAVVNGRVVDVQRVGFTIAEALKAAGVSGYGIVVGTSSPEAAIIPVKLPVAIKPSDFTNAVMLQNRPISPRVELKDSSVSIYEVGANTELAARFLLAAATSREDVIALSNAVKYAKATPRAIDLAGAASMRALTRTVEGTSDVVTVIDIGATKTTIVTRQGLFLRSVRTIEVGGEDITRSLMGATDETFEIAEKRKRSLSMIARKHAAQTSEEAGRYGYLEKTTVNLALPLEERVQDALTFSAETLIEQVAGVIESETAKYPDAPTRGIILSGGGSLLHGLKESLRNRLGTTTLLGRPWAVLEPGGGNKQILRSMDEPSAMVELSTAIGLALWEEK